jgi:endoglucanase
MACDMLTHVPDLAAALDMTKSHRYSCWARSQIKYILGDCGRSYVVGFGKNPPTHIHHRGASCPPEQLPWGSNNPTCSYDQFSMSSSNPNVITGALVGGTPMN